VGKGKLFTDPMIRSILFIFLIAFGEQEKILAQKLLMPKEEYSTIKTDSNSYTIILTDDSIYSYVGTLIRNVKRWALTDTISFIKDFLAKKKKIGANKIVVLIKPSASTYVQNTVTMLDQMVIYGIKRYAMADLDEEEKKYFHLESFSFNPPEPVEITMPESVASINLPETNAVLIKIDKNDKVYFSVLAKNDSLLNYVITKLNSEKNLGLTLEELEHYKKTTFVGVPFSQLKAFLDRSGEQQKKFNQPGIPLDSLGGELTDWISVAKQAFEGKRLNILIQGDNDSKYKVFEMVIAALKRNELFKYQLVTSND
jgi:biopolymer transport protein ExbD